MYELESVRHVSVQLVVCFHMCCFSLWEEAKQIKVQQLSDNAGTGSEHPELAAILTVKTTGPGNWLLVCFFLLNKPV